MDPTTCQVSHSTCEYNLSHVHILILTLQICFGCFAHCLLLALYKFIVLNFFMFLLRIIQCTKVGVYSSTIISCNARDHGQKQLHGCSGRPARGLRLQRGRERCGGVLEGRGLRGRARARGRQLMERVMRWRKAECQQWLGERTALRQGGG